MTVPFHPDPYASHLFNEEADLPPDAHPQPKRRGRPPGSKTKKSPAAREENKSVGRPASSDPMTSPREEKKKEQRPPQPEPMTSFLPKPAVPPQTALEHYEDAATIDKVTARLKEKAALLDFRKFGTRARTPVLILQDTSPSEAVHEEEWTTGCLSIPAEIGKVVAARNLIDVIHCSGAETFEVLSVTHAKDFRFPEGEISYGTSTRAIPWLNGIRAAISAYTGELAGLGIGVRESVVVICSDFQFRDDFRPALAAFKAWTKAQRVTLVAAVFGNASMVAAAEFATEGVPVVRLEDVSLGAFFRAVSQSVASLSMADPEAGLMAKTIAKAVKQPKAE